MCTLFLAHHLLLAFVSVQNNTTKSQELRCDKNAHEVAEIEGKGMFLFSVGVVKYYFMF